MLNNTVRLAALAALFAVCAAAQTATTTKLAASASTVAMGWSVTFTATVSPSTATGTVTFKDLIVGAALGSATLNNGTATFTTSSLQAGLRSVVAVYGGASGTYSASGSSTLLEAVTPAAGTTFTVASTPTVGTSPFNVAAGDFNNDGKIDLAVANEGSGSVSILLGNGDGTFNAGTPISMTVNPSGIATADFNNDGNLDLVVSTTSNTVYVYLGNGSGGFTATGGSPMTYTAVGPLAVGDVNGDGIPDVMSVSVGTIEVLLGNGSGGFTSSTFAVSGGESGCLADLNGDGKLDAGFGRANFVQPYFGTGSGSFTAGTQVTFNLANPNYIGCVDLNGDGAPDLIAVGHGNNTLQGFINNGSGVLTAQTAVTGFAAPNGFGLGDFNGDGKMDVAISNSTAGTLAINIGNGAGGFTTSSSVYTTGSTPAGIAVADFNGDGLLDIAVVNNGSGTVSIYLGAGALAATTTTVSSSASPSIYGASVTFTATVSPSVATGTVTFYNGSTALGTGTLSGGQATYTTSALPAGSLTIKATYNGNSSYSGSTGSLTQTVSVVSTTTGLASSANPSKANASVTFTATVASTSGGTTPTGTVTFNNGSTALGTGTLSGGKATYSTSSLPEGADSITASYGGDGNHSSSTSSALTQTVQTNTSTTTLASSANPSPYGVALTFTATVSPSSATGTVTFYSGATSLGTGTLSGGQASYSTSLLPVGSNSITASYGGDSNDSASTSSAIDQVIAGATTFTRLSTSATSAAFGSSVTLTAAVSPTIGSSTPTGTVTFKDQLIGTALGSAALSGGVARLATTTLSAGLRSIIAVYSGDSNNKSSGSATVLQAMTPKAAQAFTAPQATSVGNAPYGMAAGDFNNDGIPDLAVANYSGGTISILLGNGSGGFTTSTIATGGTPNEIAVADLNGDGNLDIVATNYASNSIFVYLGNGAGGFTAASSNGMTVLSNPYGIAIGDANNDGIPDLFIGNDTTPTGSMSILLGNGSGGFTAATPVTLATNAAAICTADFNGDGILDFASAGGKSLYIYLGSASGTYSLSQTISINSGLPFMACADANNDGKIDIAISEDTSNAAAVYFGNGAGAFSLGGTLAGLNDPNGIVLADINGDGNLDLVASNSASYGGVTVATGNGAGTFTPIASSPLALNPYPTFSVVADFNGDGVLDIATALDVSAGAVDVVLGKAYATSTAISSSANPVGYQSPVTITAAVTRPNGTGSPTGTVTFKDSQLSGVLGTATLNSGTATITLSSLPAGLRSIVAVYSGDSNDAASGSIPLQQEVTPLQTFQGLTVTSSVSAGTTPEGIASGDFNGDGIPDLAVANAGGTISILLGNGSGGFTAGTTINTGGAPRSIAVADLNGDGYLDIVATNYSSTAGTLFIYLGNGSGGFTAAPGNGTTGPYYAYGLSIGDFNGDGIPDLLVGGEEYVSNVLNGGAYLYLGNGLGGFTPSNFVDSANTYQPSSTCVADFNGDGKLDFALGGTYGTSVYFGNGAGGFSLSQSLASSDTNYQYLACADLNGDGKPDLVLADSTSAAVFLNNGSGALAIDNSGGVFPQYGFLTAIALGDFNGSGKMGAATAALDYYYFTQGIATNSTANLPNSPISYGVYPSGIVAADFTGSGILDAAASNSGASGTASGVSILLGQSFSMTLTSSASLTPLGGVVTFTATASPQLTHGGSFTFKDGSTVLGTVASTPGTAPGGGNTPATTGSFSTSSLAAGSHSITAVFNGSQTGIAPASASAVTITVVAPSTALTSSSNPATYGPVTLTAAETPTAPGTVTFMDGTSTLGTVTLSNGQASFTTSPLIFGTHSITAVYSGSGNIPGNTSSALSQVITQGPTTVSVTSSQNSSTVSASPTITASVSSGGTATGTVTFTDQTTNTNIGTATLSSGTASVVAALAPGAHTISAAYSGDSNNLSSSGTLIQTVNKATPGISMGYSSPAATYGFSSAFSANVFLGDAPTGSVTFMEGSVSLGSAPLSGGSASLSYLLPGGSTSITAVYSGDANNNGVTSPAVGVPVNKANTATTLSATPNPSSYHQNVTYSASVSLSGSGASPSGTVTVASGSTTLCAITLAGGSGSCVSQNLPVGNNSVTAVYAGDGNYNGNTSNTITETSGNVPTLTLSSSDAVITAGQPVTFTLNVAPNSGTASGSVTFLSGSTTLGTVTLASDAASFTTSSLSAGNQTITATYSGDVVNVGASATITQFVEAGVAPITLASSASPVAYGQSVTLTATLASGSATGTVTFRDFMYGNLGTGTVSGGVASLSVSSLSPGLHTIMASYGGDGSHLASGSAPLFLSSESHVASSLSAGTSYANGAEYSFLAMGDFNNDGKPDLVAITTAGAIQVLLNSGSGFTQASGSPIALSATSIAVGDFNNDGKADLAISTPSGVVYIYTGNGLGGFTAAGSLTIGSAALGPIAAGDFNNDGKLDIAVTSPSANKVYVLLGNGSGGLTAATNSPFTVDTNPNALAVGDFNGDGRLDIATGNTSSGSGSVSVLLGDATGNFVQASGSPIAIGDVPAMLAAGDFNNDGKLDLAWASSSAKDLRILLGNGAGGFTAASGSPISTTAKPGSLALGDFNGDGKLDIASVDPSTDIALWLGNGSGGFSGASGSPFAATSAFGYAVAADFSGDGKLDVAYAANNGSFGVNVLYGSGGQANTNTALTSSASPIIAGFPLTLTATVTPTTATGTVTFTDSSTSTTLGTGALSNGVATLTTSSLAGGSVHSLLAAYGGDSNDLSSNGTFSERVFTATTTTVTVASQTALTATVAPSGAAGTVTFFDMTTGVDLGSGSLASGSISLTSANGYHGLAAGSHSIVASFAGDGVTWGPSTSLAFNQFVQPTGSGTLTADSSPASPYAVGTSPNSVAVADFNGDGKPDLAVTNNGSNTVTILLGGTTASSASPIAVGHAPTGVAAGDFNGDGKLDLAVANSTDNTVTILLGNGAGGFTNAGTIAVGTSPSAVAVGDFNGDGKLDLAVANSSANTLTILLGNGAGGFTATAASPVAVGSTQPVFIAVSDFNNDGKLDLAVINESGDTVSIMTGDGAGNFTNVSGSPLSSAGGGPAAVAIADFNKDGNMDLAITDNVTGKTVILLGTGAGTFNAASGSPYTVGTSPAGIAAADVDGDGNLDLVVANSGGNTISVLLGNGSGGFTVNPSTFATGTKPVALAAADFNGDGLTDVAIVNNGSNNVTLLLGAKAATSVALTTSSPLTFPQGTSAAYTATVTRTGSFYSDTPTGSVTFLDGTTTLATVALSSGTASYTNSTFAAGSHSLTAAYVTDAGDAASTSSALAITVNPPPPSGGAVTIGSTPSGLLVSIDGGAAAATPISKTLTAGAHTLSLVSTQAGATGTQNVFQNWTGSSAGSTNSLSITVANGGTYTYTANFQTQYYLTTSASPTAGGTITPSAWIAAGTSQSITATANGGYKFSSFSGGVTGSTSPASFTMNAPASVVANFTVAAPQLAATAGKVAISGSTLSVPITLTNSGVNAASSAAITSVTATVTVGAGTVKISSTLPVSFGTIAVGGSQAETIVFAWPSTATKATITMGFTAAGGYSGSSTATVIY